MHSQLNVSKLSSLQDKCISAALCIPCQETFLVESLLWFQPFCTWNVHKQSCSIPTPPIDDARTKSATTHCWQNGVCLLLALCIKSFG